MRGHGVLSAGTEKSRRDYSSFCKKKEETKKHTFQKKRSIVEKIIQTMNEIGEKSVSRAPLPFEWLNAQVVKRKIKLSR